MLIENRFNCSLQSDTRKFNMREGFENWEIHNFFSSLMMSRKKKMESSLRSGAVHIFWGRTQTYKIVKLLNEFKKRFFIFINIFMWPFTTHWLSSCCRINCVVWVCMWRFCYFYTSLTFFSRWVTMFYRYYFSVC